MSEESAVGGPVVIIRDSIYTLEMAVALVARPLGLGEMRLEKDIRKGRLYAVRHGLSFLVTGRQLLAWAERGQREKSKKAQREKAGRGKAKADAPAAAEGGRS